MYVYDVIIQFHCYDITWDPIDFNGFNVYNDYIIINYDENRISMYVAILARGTISDIHVMSTNRCRVRYNPNRLDVC